MTRIIPFFVPHSEDDLYPLTSALKMQEMLYKNTVASGGAINYLMLAEHMPVYSYTPRKRMERRLFRGNPECLPAPLISAGIRGGSITFHGPGQLVAYFILDMKRSGIAGSLHATATIIDIIIATLEKFGIESFTLESLAARNNKQITMKLQKQGAIESSCGQEKVIAAAKGAWVLTPDGTPKKVASLGLRISNGVTRFGCALNVSTDLSYFDHIYPCGLDLAITSMKEHSGISHAISEVAKIFAQTALLHLDQAQKVQKK
ncbi:MAG: hypothetical protein BMS9Abin13_398 [Patescibacteria group bacterium]|nr:MAG: hypothetical protein BMS9Abin13_398 [Patescibacteria group bacterium]